MHTCRRHYPGGSPGVRRSCSPTVAAFPESHRSASASVFSRLAQRSLALRPACSPGRPRRPVYTEGFRCFVASTTAPIATGWSDSCQAGLPPAEDLRLVTAHGTWPLTQTLGWVRSGRLAACDTSREWSFLHSAHLTFLPSDQQSRAPALCHSLLIHLPSLGTRPVAEPLSSSLGRGAVAMRPNTHNEPGTAVFQGRTVVDRHSLRR